MAYREFRNEATYEAPEFQGMPRTLAALDTANRIKAQRANADRQELENLKKIKIVQDTTKVSRTKQEETSAISPLETLNFD